jgi:hypothetical protein
LGALTVTNSTTAPKIDRFSPDEILAGEGFFLRRIGIVAEIH